MKLHNAALGIIAAIATALPFQSSAGGGDTIEIGENVYTFANSFAR